ncbi:Pre-rRNA-processing protein FHL1 [Nakaseomyces bracarensis]|uniref:Pre-rRNA-processing protein FHL1 n=1 Tax=Nakaseomyces bracarensis TaxID=273131 RepID=A0ABR4NYF4_9SACH
MDTSLDSRPLSQEHEETKEESNDTSIIAQGEDSVKDTSVIKDAVPSITISKPKEGNSNDPVIDDEHEVSFHNLLSGHSGVRSNSISLEEFQANRKKALGEDIEIGVGTFESISEFSPDEIHDLPTTALDFPMDDHTNISIHEAIAADNNDDSIAANNDNYMDDSNENNHINTSTEKNSIKSDNKELQFSDNHSGEIPNKNDDVQKIDDGDIQAKTENSNDNVNVSKLSFESLNGDVFVSASNEPNTIEEGFELHSSRRPSDISNNDGQLQESRQPSSNNTPKSDNEGSLGNVNLIENEESIDNVKLKNDVKSLDTGKSLDNVQAIHENEKTEQIYEFNNKDNTDSLASDTAIDGVKDPIIDENENEKLSNSNDSDIKSPEKFNETSNTGTPPKNEDSNILAENDSTSGTINIEVNDTNQAQHPTVTQDEVIGSTINSESDNQQEGLESDVSNLTKAINPPNLNDPEQGNSNNTSEEETKHNNIHNGSPVSTEDILPNSSNVKITLERQTEVGDNSNNITKNDITNRSEGDIGNKSEESSEPNGHPKSDSALQMGPQESLGDINESNNNENEEHHTEISDADISHLDEKHGSISDTDINKISTENKYGIAGSVLEPSHLNDKESGTEKNSENGTLESNPKLELPEIDTPLDLHETEKDKAEENMKLDLPENLDHDQLVKLLELDTKHTDIFEDNEMLDDGLEYEDKDTEVKAENTHNDENKIEDTPLPTNTETQTSIHSQERESGAPAKNLDSKDIESSTKEKIDSTSTNEEKTFLSEVDKHIEDRKSHLETDGRNEAAKTPPLVPMKDDEVSPGQPLINDGIGHSRASLAAPLTKDHLSLKNDTNSNTPASIINEKNSLLYPKRQNSLTPMVFQQHEIKNQQTIPENPLASKTGDTSEQNSNTNQPTIFAYARLDFQSFTFYVQTLHAIIGRRSENDFSHKVDVNLGPSKAISRRHAQIFYNFGTGRFELSIIGKNGAFVDDIFVERGNTVPLKNKSKIQIGQIPFQFILPEPDVVPSPKKEDVIKPDTKPEVKQEEKEEEVIKKQEKKEDNKQDTKEDIKVNKIDETILVKKEIESESAKKDKPAPPKPSPKKTKPKPPPPPKPKKPAKQPKKVYKPEEIPPEYRVKPTSNYSTMLTACIRKYSKEKGMSLSEIYAGIRDLYPYFKYCPDGWQSSVRHNLSLNKSFRKVSKEGKGWLWGLDEQYINEREILKQKQKEVIESKQQTTQSKPETTKKTITKTTPATTSKVVKKQNISQTLAANRANSNKSPTMDDHQRTMKYLQEQLVILTKDRKGLSKQVIANILTQALAMTINQVTQAAKSKGISGNPLTALMDKNPQHLNLILAAAVNAATAKITNGEVKQLVHLPSINSASKTTAKPRQTVTKQEMKKPTLAKSQSLPKPAKAPTPPIKTTLGSSFDPTSLSKFFQPKQAVRTISAVPTTDNKVIPSKRTRDDIKTNNEEDSEESSSSSGSSESDDDSESGSDSDSSDSDSDESSSDSSSEDDSSDDSDDDSDDGNNSGSSDNKEDEKDNEDEDERERKKLKSQESAIESLLEEEDAAFDFPNDLDDPVGELDDDDVGSLDF